MLLSVLLVLALVGLDQWVKYWVSTHLALDETAPLWEGVIQLRRVHNTGGGWSILSDYTGFLTLITALVLAVLLYLLIKGHIRHPFGRWMSLVLFSGGMGNLIDRVRLGYVVDMFDCQFMRYPVFNVADIFVVTGILGCAVYYLFLYEKYDAPKKEGKTYGAPDSDRP